MCEQYEYPFDYPYNFVPVICTKCGAAFLIRNAYPVNKRTAIPLDPEVDYNVIEQNGRRFGKYGYPEGKMDDEIRRKLEASAARSFACSNVHSNEHLIPIPHLDDDELQEILEKRVPYNSEDKSITIWTDDGELVYIKGKVFVDYINGRPRFHQKVVKETLWFAPMWKL